MAHRKSKPESGTPDNEDAKVTPVQPSADEQSGSTGRATPGDEKSRGKDSGQDHYGQSGFAGRHPERETRDRGRNKA